MTIYRSNRTKVNYRKIYTEYFGEIPKDETGRTFEIHHIDGDSNNNDPSNLVALSMQDHYDTHYAQGDFCSCLLMGGKMQLSSEEISALARANQMARLENGTHPFLDPKWQSEKTRLAVERGTHNFLGGEVQRKRIEEGRHHFIGESNPGKIAAANGTHNFLGGEVQRRMNKRLIEAGTHSTQWEWTCQCGKMGKGKSNLVQHQRGRKCLLNKNPS